MPLPADKEGRAAVKKALEGIVREISDTGTLSRETADQAFDTLYDSLRILNTDRYDQYKGVKKELRESRLYLSDADRSNIPDLRASEVQYGELYGHEGSVCCFGGSEVSGAFKVLSGAVPG